MKGFTADSNYQVVKTVAQWVGETARLSENSLGLADIELENILDDERRVFSLRLEQETNLEEGEKQQLQTAFDELLDLHAQQEREDVPASKVPAPKMLASKAVPS